MIWFVVKAIHEIQTSYYNPTPVVMNRQYSFLPHASTSIFSVLVTVSALYFLAHLS